MGGFGWFHVLVTTERIYFNVRLPRVNECFLRVYVYKCVFVWVGAKRKRKIYCLNKMKKIFVNTYLFFLFLVFYFF